MKAVKGNKEYSIEESQKKFYLDRGFDIKDGKGDIIAHGRGKTVSYDEYQKVIEKNNVLEEQVNRMQAEIKASAEKTKPSKGEKTDISGSSTDKSPDNQKG